MQNLCHSKVEIPNFSTITRDDAMLVPIIHGKGDIHVIIMKNTIEETIW